MFRELFKKHKDDEDEYFETINPVVEQRRKEKFSTPLIYDDEFKEVEIKENKVERQQAIAKIEIEDPKPIKSNYEMMEVISPMNGKTGSKVKPVIKKNTSKPIKNKPSDQLIPVISPFFGRVANADKKKEEELMDELFDDEIVEDDIIEDEIIEDEIIEDKIIEDKIIGNDLSIKKMITVEDNLRNIAKIVEEEKDHLKIIEERTGEFKLDFKNLDNNNEPSLIDEIDDNMSLDELMNLYEKKFKD